MKRIFPSVHTLTPSLQIHFNVILPTTHTDLPSHFPTEIFVCISHIFMRATCPARLIRLDLITVKMFG